MLKQQCPAPSIQSSIESNLIVKSTAIRDVDMEQELVALDTIKESRSPNLIKGILGNTDSSNTMSILQQFSQHRNSLNFLGGPTVVAKHCTPGLSLTKVCPDPSIYSLPRTGF
jgi:hypothetical protein